MHPRTRGRSTQRSTVAPPPSGAFSPPAEKSIRTRTAHPLDVLLASTVCPLALYLSGHETWTWALALGVEHMLAVYLSPKYPTITIGAVLASVVAVFSLLPTQEAYFGLLLLGSFEGARRGLSAIGGVWCHENMGEVVVTLEAIVLCGFGWLWEGFHRWYRGGGGGGGGGGGLGGGLVGVEGEEALLQAAWVVLGGTSAIALTALAGLALGVGGTPRTSTLLVWASIVAALVCEYQWVNVWVLKGRENCVVWLLGWVTGVANPYIGYTVVWWLVVLGGSLPFIPLAATLVGDSRFLAPLTYPQANLILRKVYHVVGVLILLPPLLLVHSTTMSSTVLAQYHGFLALAVACAVKVLGVLELIRALKPHPTVFPRLLHALFTRHTDDRELSSPFFLTHVYLLVGMVAPFLLRGAGVVVREGFVVSASGVLALGVGDAAAAVGGTLAAATWGKAACVPWVEVERMMVRSGVFGKGGGVKEGEGEGEGDDVRVVTTRGRRRKVAPTARGGVPTKRGSGKTLCGTLSYVVLAGGGGALCMVALGMDTLWGREGLALFTSVLGGALVEAITGSVDNALVPTFAWAFSVAAHMIFTKR